MARGTRTVLLVGVGATFALAACGGSTVDLPAGAQDSGVADSAPGTVDARSMDGTSPLSDSTSPVDSGIDTGGAILDSPIGPGPDSSPFDSSVPDVGLPEVGPGGACNTLVNTAPRIPVTWDPGPLPPATGGTILDGTYDETAFVIYTGSGGDAGATGATHQFLAVLSGGGTMMQVVFDDTPGVDNHVSFALAPAGTSPNMTQTCPMPGPTPWDGYIATDTSVTFLSTTHNESYTLTHR